VGPGRHGLPRRQVEGRRLRDLPPRARDGTPPLRDLARPAPRGAASRRGAGRAALPRVRPGAGPAQPLPDDDGRRSGDQQAWTPEQRTQLIEHVGDLARETIDDPEAADWATIRETRNRALAAVLAFTGIRGSELFANSQDDRRNGITWDDVDLDEGTVTVLSKKQQWDDRSLPPQTLHALRQLQRVLDTPDDWPVFVSLHRPSVYEAVRSGLRDDGLADDRIEAILAERGPFDLLREFEHRPPALTTDGARRVMQAVTEAAGIEVAEGYLQPHGGRRGIGEVMVRTRGFTAAARVLDDSEEMVRQRYSHIEAGELAEELGAAIDAVDGGDE
jgi:integrase